MALVEVGGCRSTVAVGRALGDGFRLGVVARERDRYPKPVSRADAIECIGGLSRTVRSTARSWAWHRMTHKRGSFSPDFAWGSGCWSGRDLIPCRLISGLGRGSVA